MAWLSWGLQLCEPGRRPVLSWLARLVHMTLGRTGYQTSLDLSQPSGPRMLQTRPQGTVGQRGQAAIFGSVRTWALSLTCCVTLNKLLSHFDTPFVTVCKREGNDNSYFPKGTWNGMKKNMFENCSTNVSNLSPSSPLPGSLIPGGKFWPRRGRLRDSWG